MKSAGQRVGCGDRSDGEYSNGRFAEDAGAVGGKYISGMSIKTDSNGDRYVDVDLTTEIQKKLQAAGSMDEKRDIVYRYIMDSLRNVYPTNDGRDVVVVGVSAKKLTHHAPNVRIHAIPEIANMIKSGSLVEIKDVTHPFFTEFAYYGIALKVGDGHYTAVMNIGIRKNGESVLYDINQFQEKAATSDIGKVRRSAPAEEAAAINSNNITDPAPESKKKNKKFSPATGGAAHDDFIDI